MPDDGGSRGSKLGSFRMFKGPLFLFQVVYGKLYHLPLEYVYFSEICF